MRHAAVRLCALALLALLLPVAACSPVPEDGAAADFPLLQGPWLGQTLPGAEPALFAPGVVSNGMANRDVCFSPDGDEVFFGVTAGGVSTVLHSRLVDGAWTEPDIPSFARDLAFAVFEPAFSADGNTLYYLTNLAAPGQEQQPGWGTQNIFAVDREGDGWGEPYALPAPITSDAGEFYPSFTADGTLYFCRQDPATGQVAVMRSRPVDGAYGEPETLPPAVNCGQNRYNAYVARDESFLIVCVVGHPDNLGPVDYYVCFRSADDAWSEAVNMGPVVNAPGSRASSVSVTPGGGYLIFAATHRPEPAPPSDGSSGWRYLRDLHNRPENGNSDVYWVDAAFIEGLRPAAD